MNPNYPPDYIEPPHREYSEEEMESLAWEKVDDTINTIRDDN